MFINKASKLIEDTRNQINKQSEQFSETIEKIDVLIIDVHKFVNLASESMEKINDMSDKISILANKVDAKTQSLMNVLDQVAIGTKSFYESVHKPIRTVINFFQSFSDNFSFVKSLFPKRNSKSM